jgi:tetratricopeptide (TPR) repeat protein
VRTVIALLAVGVAGFSPFRAEEPNVREGNERLLAGDPADSLRRYDAAEEAAGSHAEIDYDRGNALHRMGRSAEARDAWRRALERADPGLSSRALQNIGTALAAEGDREGAIAAFTGALRKDPGNEDARFDLEVLLRKEAAGAKGPQEGDRGGGEAGGSPQPDPGRGRQAEAPTGSQPQQQPPAAQEPEHGPRGERQAQPQAGRPEDAPERGDAEAEEGAEPRPTPLSRQDAERLLDALRARERNMPLAGRERKNVGRKDAEKDW